VPSFSAAALAESRQSVTVTLRQGRPSAVAFSTIESSPL
jgi:hypothetical protein